MSEYTPHIHVCQPVPLTLAVRQLKCLCTETPHPVLVRVYEWYGVDCTCLWCGERWSDGELRERPFKPRWRRESIDSAIRYAKQNGIHVDLSDAPPLDTLVPPKTRKRERGVAR